MVDSTRRHEADEGGRNPLTEFPLVPIACVISDDLLTKLRDKSETFISPSSLKPYGVTALCRIIVQDKIELLDRYYEMDFLSYLGNRTENVSGRASIGAIARKASLLIPKPLIDRINKKVEAFNNPLIGTSTILRFLIEKGLEKCRTEDLYKYIPPKHMTIMVTKELTISDLQAQYRRTKPAK